MQGFGGDTSNMAIAAARLGARVGYVTRARRRRVRPRCSATCGRAEGVDTRGVAIDAEAPTGVYFVTHGAHGHEFSYLRAGSAASRMRPDDAAARRDPRRARLLHVSGISQAISATRVRHGVRRDRRRRAARARSSPTTPTCGSSCGRCRGRARRSWRRWRRCTWCLPSLDDARVLFERDDADAAVDAAAIAPARRGVVAQAAAPTAASSPTASDSEHVAAHRVDAGRCHRRRRLLRRRVRRAHPGRRRSRSPPRATPMPPRRSPRPASARSRRCRATPMCARCPAQGSRMTDAHVPCRPVFAARSRWSSAARAASAPPSPMRFAELRRGGDGDRRDARRMRRRARVAARSAAAMRSRSTCATTRR